MCGSGSTHAEEDGVRMGGPSKEERSISTVKLNMQTDSDGDLGGVYRSRRGQLSGN